VEDGDLYVLETPTRGRGSPRKLFYSRSANPVLAEFPEWI
jgi:hypothetical protein